MNAKDEVRRAVLERRAHRTEEDRELAGEAIAAHTDAIPALAGAKRVAAYLSMPSEPSTVPLIEHLLRRGIKLIVPVVVADRTLVWTQVKGDSVLQPGPLGVPQPESGKLKRLDSADFAFVPALAVDHMGHRLGRGAGYYDRALEDADLPTCALVFDDEILESVPVEPHDIQVNMAVSPTGLIRF